MRNLVGGVMTPPYDGVADTLSYISYLISYILYLSSGRPSLVGKCAPVAK